MFQIEKLQNNERDTKALARLEKAIFSDAWSQNALRETLNQSQAIIFGAWNQKSLAGYVILYYVLDECEIARIAVTPSCRRQGVAGALLLTAEQFCQSKGIKRILLDVRETNTPAIAFYKTKGFQTDGIRKNYYTNPPENAILMSRKQVNSGNPDSTFHYAADSGPDII